MSEVSIEYAKALKSIYDGKEAEAYELLKDMSEVLKDKDIYQFFTYPFTNKEDKKNVIRKTFEDSNFRNFLFVLVDNDRMGDIDDIAYEFKKILDSMNNVKQVTVYSKTELSEEYMEKLKAKMEEKLDKKVFLKNEIDDSIIAGVRIAYDSKQIDLTLNSRFDQLLNSLKEQS